MHRPILRRAALVALALCTPLAALGNEPQRAAAAPRAALPAFDETFTPPAFDSVERPEFGLSAGTALDVSVEPVVHQASNVFILALAVTVLVVLGTLFATWWLGRTRTPQGNPVWAFTMGSRLTLGFGGLITALMVNFLVATHGMDQVKDVETRYARAIKLSVLSGAAQSQAYFASEATQRFINLENNESLKDVSDALATAHAAIDTMQEVNEGLIDLTEADAMDVKIDAFDQALQQVVQLTDRDNAIVASQMTPAIRRAATVLNETVEAFQSRGDHATATSFANAEAHLHRMRVNFFRYKDTRDTADYDLLVREFNSVNDIMTAQQRTPAGADASKQIAFILASIGFYRERAAEVRTLMEQRAQVMNTQLLPLKKELVDLATVLNNDTATRADELNRESAQTIATSRFTSIVVLIVFGAAAFAAGCLIVITIKRGVEKVLTVLQAVAAGDLRVQPLGNTSNDEIGRLSQATDAMADSLRNMVSELRGTSDQVAAAATEIAASSEEMARGLEQQADQVNQISSAVQEMSASVVEVAQKSTGAADRARNAGNQAQEGNAVVDQTIEGMRSINEAVSQGASSVQELGKRGEQIGEIIKVINDIADQTNLLALNAAIEAARAGEHGRGFAVVADEVRKLAERTQKATEEVGQSIRAIQDETRVAVERMQSGTEQVKVGVEKAQSAGTALMTIVTSSGEVASMIQEIAAAAEQQGSASEEVSRSLEAISSVTREATAGASQAAQAAGELSGKAEQLREVIARFKVAGSETTSAAKAPKPAKKPGKASPVAA